MLDDFDDDLMSREAIRDPYAYFGRLREADPVHWNEQHRSWIVTRCATRPFPLNG